MTLTTETVWAAMSRNIFAVLAFTNAAGEPRSAGIVYIVDGRSLLISTARDSWKVRHIRQRPAVSMTIAIPKRVPFLPFIKVPAATITFHGDAEVLGVEDIDAQARNRLFRSSRLDDDMVAETRIIRVRPRSEFLTYGIDMPVWQMAGHEQARARVPSGAQGSDVPDHTSRPEST